MWQWDNLDPFGNSAANENPGGLGTFKYAMRFLGQYYDTETATHYNYVRDYDPSVGRYVQSDPIGLLRQPRLRESFPIGTPTSHCARRGFRFHSCGQRIPWKTSVASKRVPSSSYQ